MPFFTTFRRRGLAVVAGAAVASSALVGVGATAAHADTTASTTAECRFGEHMVALWLALPVELRGDLRRLQELEPGERAPFARDIRDDARGGEYGSGVQHRAERVQQRRVAVWATMPQELKDDLLALAEVAPQDRRQAAQDIADAALDGEYGTKVQAVTEHIRSSDRWQDCVAE